MPVFSQFSLNNLSTIDPKLQGVLHEAIKHVDFRVLSGRRTPAEQRELYAQGRTKPGRIVTWTLHSNHVVEPPGLAQAVDIAPWPVTWESTRFYYFAGWIMAIAAKQGIKLRWGGDWNMNTDTADEKRHDLGHFELV